MSNLWSAGDFGRIAAAAIMPGESLCDAVPVYAGDVVLDIGCGTGNTAFSAARRRAKVTGIDPTAALLAQARRRADFDGFEIRFDEGGAEALPYGDNEFDVALSTYGMVFSELPEDCVREAARVLKPGGKLAITSWARGGMNDRMFELCTSVRPGMKSFETAREWGNESFAAKCLGAEFATVTILRKPFYARALSVEQWLAGMKSFLSPVILAYEGLDEAGAKSLDERFLALGAEFNRSPKEGLFGVSEYLEIIAAKA